MKNMEKITRRELMRKAVGIAGVAAAASVPGLAELFMPERAEASYPVRSAYFFFSSGHYTAIPCLPTRRYYIQLSVREPTFRFFISYFVQQCAPVIIQPYQPPVYPSYPAPVYPAPVPINPFPGAERNTERKFETWLKELGYDPGFPENHPMKLFRNRPLGEKNRQTGNFDWTSESVDFGWWPSASPDGRFHAADIVDPLRNPSGEAKVRTNEEMFSMLYRDKVLYGAMRVDLRQHPYLIELDARALFDTLTTPPVDISEPRIMTY